LPTNFPEQFPSQDSFTTAESQQAVQQVQERLDHSHATRDLGFEVVKVDRGRATFHMKVAERHRQVHGVVHGGILATLADTVAAVAAYSALPRGTAIATIEMNINFLEAIPSGLVRAEARVLRVGRNFVVTECELWNEEGLLAAKSLLTFGAVADRVGDQLKKGPRD
jgi:uncharacterized protein (TIGR00369 family)